MCSNDRRDELRKQLLYSGHLMLLCGIINNELEEY